MMKLEINIKPKLIKIIGFGYEWQSYPDEWAEEIVKRVNGYEELEKQLETEEESSKYVVDMLQSKNCDLIAFIKETRVYFEREMGGQSCWTEHIDKLIERVE